MSEVVARKRRAKRRAILDAAARHFADQGYHSARMADIAEDVGLQKAALYYYFESKEALLVELIRTRLGVALEALTAVTSTGHPPTDKVAGAVDAHLRVFHEHADLYTIFNSERLHLISSEAAAVVDDLGRQYEKHWGEMLGEGMRSGAFHRDLDVPIVVKAILGMLNTTLVWFDPDGRLTVGDLAERYRRLILAMLSGVTPSATAGD